MKIITSRSYLPWYTCKILISSWNPSLYLTFQSNTCNPMGFNTSYYNTTMLTFHNKICPDIPQDIPQYTPRYTQIYPKIYLIYPTTLLPITTSALLRLCKSVIILSNQVITESPVLHCVMGLLGLSHPGDLRELGYSWFILSDLFIKVWITFTTHNTTIILLYYF